MKEILWQSGKIRVSLYFLKASQNFIEFEKEPLIGRLCPFWKEVENENESRFLKW